MEAGGGGGGEGKGDQLCGEWAGLDPAKANCQVWQDRSHSGEDQPQLRPPTGFSGAGTTLEEQVGQGESAGNPGAGQSLPAR